MALSGADNAKVRKAGSWVRLEITRRTSLGSCLCFQCAKPFYFLSPQILCLNFFFLFDLMTQDSHFSFSSHYLRSKIKTCCVSFLPPIPAGSPPTRSSNSSPCRCLTGTLPTRSFLSLLFAYLRTRHWLGLNVPGKR